MNTTHYQCITVMNGTIDQDNINRGTQSRNHFDFQQSAFKGGTVHQTLCHQICEQGKGEERIEGETR